jgi:PAS domain S-box-containing protein
MESMDGPDNRPGQSSEGATAGSPLRLMEMLRQIREDLVRPLGAVELFDGLYRSASHFLQLDAFLFALYDEHSRTIEVVRQIESGRILPGGTFPLGQGPTSQVIITRQSRLIREWSGTPPFTLQFLSDRNSVPQSALITPVVHGSHVVGVISCFAARPNAFDESDLVLLELVAGFAAGSVITLRSSERADEGLRRRLSTLEAILADMADALLIVDEAGRVIRLNGAARQLLSLTDSSVLVGQLLDQSSWQDWPASARMLAETLVPVIRQVQVGATVAETEFELPGRARMVLSVVGTPLRDGAGALVGGILLIRDVTTARELSEVKDEVLAIASHDLRTPLTVIRAQAQFLRRGIRLSSASMDDLDQGLHVIIDQSDHVELLLARLLDLSQIEAGRFELQRDRVDLLSLVEQTVKQLQTLSAEHRLVVEAQAPVVGNWDGARLHEVLDNLIGNAIKYSPRGGDVIVQIGFDPTERNARIAIRDSGVGLTPDEATHIFERYYRGQRVRTLEGAGLGLYICQNIVEAHGGRIWALSEGPGAGATFTFTLPVG